MHQGNINFRNLVQKYRMSYCTVPKGDKGALARFLCNYVRAKNGRFLRQDPTDKKWYEVGDEKAIFKCGQALREGSSEFTRANKDGGSRCGVPMYKCEHDSFILPDINPSTSVMNSSNSLDM